MANHTVESAAQYHVSQTLGGSCWLAALACAMKQTLSDSKNPTENTLKLSAVHMKCGLEWAKDQDWQKLVGFLNDRYAGKLKIAPKAWNEIVDSAALANFIAKVVNSCGSVILTVKNIDQSTHDIPILGIQVNTANPLNSMLTVCDPLTNAPVAMTLNKFWARGIKHVTSVRKAQ